MKLAKSFLIVFIFSYRVLGRYWTIIILLLYLFDIKLKKIETGFAQEKRKFTLLGDDNFENDGKLITYWSFYDEDCDNQLFHLNCYQNITKFCTVKWWHREVGLNLRHEIFLISICWTFIRKYLFFPSKFTLHIAAFDWTGRDLQFTKRFWIFTTEYFVIINLFTTT